MKSENKTQAAEVEIKIIGIKQALNTWTIATATINGQIYKIQMVRFDEPSQYGIRQGKISKLFIADPAGKECVNYDRGWDKRPSDENSKDILAAILVKFN